MPADAIFRIYSMTKPIVSVAAMTLVEEGRLLLTDPLAKYLPAFAEMKVGVERDGALELVPAKRPITIHDLMRHTSGLTYGFAGATAVHRLVAEADIVNVVETDRRADRPPRRAAARPPARRSVGIRPVDRRARPRAGGRLGQCGSANFSPSGCWRRSAWSTPPSSRRRTKRDRLAAPLAYDALIAAGASTSSTASAPPPFEMGGSGLVSTIGDYARFLAMIAGGGDARRRAHPRAAHARLHGERPPRSRDRPAQPLSHARPRLWPRLRRAQRDRRRADDRLGRRNRLGRRFRRGVLGLAARRPVRDRDDARARPLSSISVKLFRNMVNAAIL